MTDQTGFKVVGEEPQPDRYRSCRRMLVGPWCNQPEEYEGYNGFVGWAGVNRVQSGRWFVVFNSGYWHASYPWTDEIKAQVLKDEASRKDYEHWRELGKPEIRAPRGGRIHIMHSDDEGVTWSAPETLVDTELTDLHPTLLELDDGTLLCTFCSDGIPEVCRSSHILSYDGAKTWTDPIDSAPGNVGGFGNGCTIQLSDGRVIWPIEVREGTGETRRIGIGIFISSDKGKTFQRISLVTTDHAMCEPTIAELPSGRLVLVCRREGDIFWSDDGGQTWTAPTTTGVAMYDPHLLVMPNGVLACFHGSYGKGALRVILSPDGGETWHGPGDHYGYSVDPSVYGYSHPMLLRDGTAYITYIHTGGIRTADARTEAIWALRVKVHDAADGIDILPAPGSPAAIGRATIGPDGTMADPGDAALGATV